MADQVATNPNTEGQSSPSELAKLSALDRAALRKSRGFWTQAWINFRSNRLAMVALGMTVLIILSVIFSGVISRYVTGFSPNENHLAQKLTPPFTDGYILGSDGNGRDELTRLLYGGRASLLIAALTTVMILGIGATLGSVAGFFGKFPDTLITRLVDILLSVPTLPLLVLVSSLFQPGVFGLSLFIALVSWGGVTRIVRGEVIKFRHQEFIEAARLMGGSNFRIISKHIMPNVLPIVVVWTSLVIPGLILLEATLSYLGLGIKPPTPSWGNMLQENKQYMRSNWSLVFIPGFMIYITALSIYLVGSGLRDALDPRLTKK